MNKFSVMMVLCDLHSLDFAKSEDTYTFTFDPSLSMLSNRVRVNYPQRNESSSSGIKIWGTCKGLVCVTCGNDRDVVLWNTATKEFKELPTVPDRYWIETGFYKHGFCYDDEIDDFKVVCFVGSKDCQTLGEVQVYTLKSNSWRRIENVPDDLCVGFLVMSQVIVNGATHFLASIDSKPDAVIASFNFKDERFDEMPLPSSFDEYDATKLCSLRGSLYLHGSIGGRIDVWEMEYGVTDSWAKLFTINIPIICQFPRLLDLLQFVKNGEVLLGYDTNVDYHLDLYDTKLGTSMNLKTYATGRSHFATTFVYMGSLVPLNSGTYIGQPEIETKRPQRLAGTRTVDSNSVDHVGVVERRDLDDDEEEQEIAKGFPVCPKSVDGDGGMSPQKSRQMMERYSSFMEKYMDLERRNLDLKTREQETRHMSMDTSKMYAC